MTIPFRDKRVIVIGGGISGLAAAFHILRQGIEVRVLESAARPGGLIRSERRDGFLLEHAATCIFNFLPDVDLFCRALGLDERMVDRREAAKRRYLIRDGRPVAVPMSGPGFLASRLLSPMGKLRLMLEPFVPRGAPDNDRESIAGFISRRFGREFYERTIEPYVSGTLAGDGERACLRSVFKQFASLEAEHGSIIRGAVVRRMRGIRSADCQARVFSFLDGMAMLTDAAATQLGAHFLPERPVQGIDRVGRRWQVTATRPDGTTETHEADAVVIATPADVAGGLTGPLRRDMGLLLGGITYAPMVVSYLGFSREQVAHDLDGIGCLAPKRERDFNILGSLWPTTLFDRRGPDGQALFMNYLGGARAAALTECSDDRLTDLSITDLRRMVGVRGEPHFSRIIRHRRALPQYNIGHQMFLTDLENNLRHLPGLFVTGNYLHGVSVRACISNGVGIAGRVAALLHNSGRDLAPPVLHSPADDLLNAR